MKIHLNNMIFYGYHGVHPEERKLGQRFIVTLTVETDPKLDQGIHSLEQTVDYTKVFDEVKNIMETHQFYVLEKCANEILDKLFMDFQEIVCANIRIKKPFVAINASLDGVEVEMERRR